MRANHPVLCWVIFCQNLRNRIRNSSKKLLKASESQDLFSAAPPRSGTTAGPCSPGRSSARNRTPAASPARHNTERQMNWCTDWCKIIFRPFSSLHYPGRSDHSGGNVLLISTVGPGRSDHSGGNVLLISTVGLVGNGPHKPP